MLKLDSWLPPDPQILLSLATEAASVCCLPSGLVKISNRQQFLGLYIPQACFPEGSASHAQVPGSKSGEEGLGTSELKLKGLLSYLRVEEREAGTLRWLGGGHFEVTMKGLGGGRRMDGLGTSLFLGFYHLCPKAGTRHSFLQWLPSDTPETTLSSPPKPLHPSASSHLLSGSPHRQSTGTGVYRETVLCSHCQTAPQRMTDLPLAEFSQTFKGYSLLPCNHPTEAVRNITLE